MAIVTIKASKATSGKVLDYITDKGKSAFVSCLHLDPSQDLARQMMANFTDHRNMKLRKEMEEGKI